MKKAKSQEGGVRAWLHTFPIRTAPPHLSAASGLHTGDAKVRLKRVWPTMANMIEFGTCMGPLFAVFLAKNSTYLLIQSSVTILDFVLVAAHQVRVCELTLGTRNSHGSTAS